MSGAAIYHAKTEQIVGILTEQVVTTIHGLRHAVELVPSALRESPAVVEIQTLTSRMETQFDQLKSLLAIQSTDAAKSGRRLFWLGVVLGLPIGLLGTLIAKLLGWG